MCFMLATIWFLAGLAVCIRMLTLAIPHLDVLYESKRNDILLQVRIVDRLQSVQNILRT